MEFLNNYREYLILKAEVAAGEEKQEELLKAQEFLIQKPVVFDPYDDRNQPRANEEQLAEMLATMEENGAATAGMTEYDFYSRVRFLKKKYKAMAGE